jgi:hypothetical protein
VSVGGATEVVTVSLGTAELAQHSELFFGLDSFGDEAQAESVCED